jgi:hypothetical protein
MQSVCNTMKPGAVGLLAVPIWMPSAGTLPQTRAPVLVDLSHEEKHMLSATTAGYHTTTTKRPNQMATRTGKPAARRIVALAAAGPLVLASALALAPPVHAAAEWMAGAVNSSSISNKKPESFFYTNAYTQSDAEQHAMASCKAKYPTGCQLAGSTTSCMAVALGAGSQYAVAYAPSVQAAQVLAAMEIHGRVNPSGARCSWY